MNASVDIVREDNTEQGKVAERGQCLLVRIDPHQLLVPRTLVAEVVRYEGTALAVTSHPDIRRFPWRGFQVPVLNAALIHGDCVQSTGDDSKIIVFYGLSNHTRLPYYGVVASRNPRLVTVTEESVVASGDQQNLSLAQAAIVAVDEESAIIPKVDYLEKFILENAGTLA